MSISDKGPAKMQLEECGSVINRLVVVKGPMTRLDRKPRRDAWSY